MIGCDKNRLPFPLADHEWTQAIIALPNHIGSSVSLIQSNMQKTIRDKCDGIGNIIWLGGYSTSITHLLLWLLLLLPATNAEGISIADILSCKTPTGTLVLLWLYQTGDTCDIRLSYFTYRCLSHMKNCRAWDYRYFFLSPYGSFVEDIFLHNHPFFVIFCVKLFRWSERKLWVFPCWGNHELLC